MSGHYWVRRRRPTRFAVLIALVGLAIVVLVQYWPNRQSIEDNLATRSTAALTRAGITGAQVEFTGRDGHVRVASPSDVDRAEAVVRDVDGVRAVSATAPGIATGNNGSPAGANAPTVTVTVERGQAVVTGTVPSEAARIALINGIGAALGSGSVRDQLTVDPSRTDAGLTGLPAVVSGMGAGATGATIQLGDGTITLTGTVDSAEAKTNAAAAAGTAVGAAHVRDQLTVAAGPAIQQQLAGLPRITFQSGSATLTPAGRAVVERVATLLTANPTIKIRIEGHTDGTGTDGANLILSRSRAETVRGTLVALGIAADRLTSVGYGETRPKVPDTSPANQAINRRVEFVVLG